MAAGTASDGLPVSLARWLRPGHPRVSAAVLLVIGAVTTIVAWGALGRLLGVDRAGSGEVVAFMLQPLAIAVLVVGLAAFVLTGSSASRWLGALGAVAGAAVPLVPLQRLITRQTDLTADTSAVVLLAPFVLVVLVHLAAVVALAVRAPTNR